MDASKKRKIEKSEKKKSLKQRYEDITLMKTAVYNNDPLYDEHLIPIDNMFYVLLSQVFKNHRIAFGAENKELRYSFFHIQDSRTGKGQLIKPIKDSADTFTKMNLPLSWVKVTSFSDAGLIGSINQEAIIHNTKKNAEQGDEDYIDPVIKGDLAHHDFIFFEEAKSILKTGKNTEMTMTIFQEALDSPGRIRKKLRSDHAIEYDCTASIIAMTYYLPEITQTLLEQGFFQRMGIYNRVFTNKETIILRKNILKMYQMPFNLEEYNYRVELFCKDILKIKSKLDSKNLIRINTDAFNYLEKMIMMYEKEILRKSNGDENRILKSFSQTIIDTSIKFGAINALTRKTSIIGHREIKEGYKLISSTINTVSNKLSSSEKIDDKMIRNIKHRLRSCQKDTKTGKVTKMMFQNHLKKKTDMTMKRAKNIIDECLVLNILEEIPGERNTRFIEVNE